MNSERVGKVQTKREATQRGRGGGSGEVHALFLLVSSRNRGIGSDATITNSLHYSGIVIIIITNNEAS